MSSQLRGTRTWTRDLRLLTLSMRCLNFSDRPHPDRSHRTQAAWDVLRSTWRCTVVRVVVHVMCQSNYNCAIYTPGSYVCLQTMYAFDKMSSRVRMRGIGSEVPRANEEDVRE